MAGRKTASSPLEQARYMSSTYDWDLGVICRKYHTALPSFDSSSALGDILTLIAMLNPVMLCSPVSFYALLGFYM